MDSSGRSDLARVESHIRILVDQRALFADHVRPPFGIDGRQFLLGNHGSLHEKAAGHDIAKEVEKGRCIQDGEQKAGALAPSALASGFFISQTGTLWTRCFAYCTACS